MKAIGLFGGAFAPFHNGHLRLALEAKDRLELDEVRLIPTAHPPHRPDSRVTPQRRLEWVRAAIRKAPGLVADDVEIQRAGNGPSYTVDTLSALRLRYPSASLVLLMGADAFGHLHTWHRWADILELAHIAVVARLGSRLEPSPECAALLAGKKAVAAQLLQQPSGFWKQLEVPVLDISSTRIRRLMKAKQSVRGLVPDAILNSLTPSDISALTKDDDAATTH